MQRNSKRADKRETQRRREIRRLKYAGHPVTTRKAA